MSKTIGRYEIQAELGRGGMATVYLAFDPRLDRQVALKLMDQELANNPNFAARFEREAKAVASLEHSSIVSLYDFGEADSWLYLVMRYMRGGTLKEQIANKPLTIARAYEVVRRIGEALDKAHSRGIIHRDLKPANILLDEDQKPYLSDFGIVKVASGDTEMLTETGQTLGTFAYMSPEQLLGKEINGQSDIYALGIVLYEMLAGVHPYADVASTPSAMAIAHAQSPIPKVSETDPTLPTKVDGIIYKAMAKDAGDRYATGAEMTQALQAALVKQSPPAPVQSTADVVSEPKAESTGQPPLASQATERQTVQPQKDEKQPGKQPTVPPQMDEKQPGKRQPISSCCLFTLFALLVPRLAILLSWLNSPTRWDMAFGSFIWAFIGLVFLPWTTLMYVVVAPSGIVGYDWFYLLLAIIIDIVFYVGGGIGNRGRIPGVSKG